MELQVVARRSETRCAWCRGDGDLVACEGCATLLHAACWQASRSCPTLGCGVPRGTRRRRRASSRQAAQPPAERLEAEHGLLVGAALFFWGAAQVGGHVQGAAAPQLPALTRGLLALFEASGAPAVRLALGLALLLAWRSPPHVRARLVRAASIAWLPLVLLVAGGLSLPLLCQLVGGP